MKKKKTSEKKDKKGILSSNLFLYLTEFFAGMSVMAVELGASRLLAPYFSSSQIVWTIIIGTIMIAMALGNLYGGRSADKNPDPDKLYRRIIIAAIWIAAIPVAGKYVIVVVAGLIIFSVNSGYLIWAAFAACMIVFVFPLFLLGTVTPSLVKYAVSNLENSGKTVGRLNAFNTVGSIIGTFVPTFISIPSVGTSITFLIFAGILLALSLVYFICVKRRKVSCIVAVVLFAACCVFGHDASFAFWEKDLAYEGESVYNYLQVTEDDSAVYLSTNVLIGIQSVYVKDSDRLTGMYYDYAMAAPYMAGVKEKDNLELLVLGMGSGTYVTQCNRFFDNIHSVGVEIDDKITALSREYFNLDKDIPVVTYDGRAYLNADKNKYDVILVDAYQDITIPFQMSSTEFFKLVSSHLNDDGVMVVNLNMRGGEDEINTYLCDTIASVFPYVYRAELANSTSTVLYVGKSDKMLETMDRNLALEDNELLSSTMQTIRKRTALYTGGDNIMTDDKAPVELLGMKVIDDLIADELEYYKSMIPYYKKVLKEKGLRALINEL